METIGTQDFCNDCFRVVVIVDDSIESDDFGVEYRVISFSCGHDASSKKK